MPWFSSRFGIQLIPQKLAQYVFYIKTCMMYTSLYKSLYKSILCKLWDYINRQNHILFTCYKGVLRSWVDILWKVIQVYILFPFFWKLVKNLIRNWHCTTKIIILNSKRCIFLPVFLLVDIFQITMFVTKHKPDS